MAAPATAPQTDTAIDAFVRLVRAQAAVTRELSAQLSADHGLSINAYEALLILARAPESRMRRVDLAGRSCSARVGAGARPPAAAVTRTRARAARLQRSAARGIVGTAV